MGVLPFMGVDDAPRDLVTTKDDRASATRIGSDLRPTLLAACWASFGLRSEQVRIKNITPDSIVVSCMLCNGDMCVQQAVAIAVPGPPLMSMKDALERHEKAALLKPPSMSAALALRLLATPLALLAIGGMLALAYCCYEVTSSTDLVLSLLGGRGHAWLVLYAAAAAHALEAAYAFRLLTAARPAGERPCAMGWLRAIPFALLVFLCGFPVLRFVKILAPKAMKAE